MAERDSLVEQLEALKLRHDRDRNKLKFYKNEYYSFELARKAFEEKQESHAKENKERDEKIRSLSEANKQLAELEQVQSEMIKSLQ